MLGCTVEGRVWTKSIYEIQKLYSLGVVTDQIRAISIGNTVTIGRIPEEKSIVSVTAIKTVEKKMDYMKEKQKYYIENLENLNQKNRKKS